MFSLKKILGLTLATLLMSSADAQQRLPVPNKLIIGKKSSVSKVLEFDINDANKPSIRANQSTKKLEFTHDGSTFKTVGSGGSGGKNYLEDWFDVEGPIGSFDNNLGDTDGVSGRPSLALWGSSDSSTIALITVSGSSALRGAQSYQSNGGGNNATGSAYVETPCYSLEGADIGVPLFFTADINNAGADGDWDVTAVVRNSSGIQQRKASIAGNASTATVPSAKIPVGKSSFIGFFVPGAASTDKVCIRFRRLASNSQITIDSLSFGPQQKLIGMSDTGWISFPTFLGSGASTQGFGSVTGGLWRHRFLGDTYYFQYEFTVGSSTPTEARVIFPVGIESEGAKVISSIQPIGAGFTNNGGSQQSLAIESGGKPYVVFTDPSNFGTKYNGNTVATSGWVLSGYGAVPIKNSNSNVQAGFRQGEEYVCNSSTNNTSSDNSSFAYGIEGCAVGSITASLNRRVRLQTPRLPTDDIALEFDVSGTGQWIKVANNPADVTNGRNIAPFLLQGSTEYGAYLREISPTDYDVHFGQYRINGGGSYGAAGDTWSQVPNARWRVRKVVAGGAVGFPLAGENVLVKHNSTQYMDVLKSGTYTPTLAADTNINTFVSHPLQWFQIGKVIHFAGAFEASTNATGNSLLQIPLPVTFSGTFTNSSDQCGGTINGLSDQNVGIIRPVSGQQYAWLQWNAPVTNNRLYWFSATCSLP